MKGGIRFHFSSACLAKVSPMALGYAARCDAHVPEGITTLVRVYKALPHSQNVEQKIRQRGSKTAGRIQIQDRPLCERGEAEPLRLGVTAAGGRDRRQR